jgi:hypothetical protein
VRELLLQHEEEDEEGLTWGRSMVRELPLQHERRMRKGSPREGCW